MQKLITRIRAAYDARDVARLHKAARALVVYDQKRAFATVVNPDAAEIVALAARVAAVTPEDLRPYFEQ